MIPAGYMAKLVCKTPAGMTIPKTVVDIYSLSGCISDNFADYIPHWKHNGYWLFDSPEIIKSLAAEQSIDLAATTLFYYETDGREFDGETWHAYVPEPAIPTNIVVPVQKKLEGFDVVTFWAKSSPECSPLSCNSLAEEIVTSEHCLLASHAEAETYLNRGAFKNAEPGPYRIFAVYSVSWPGFRPFGTR